MIDGVEDELYVFNLYLGRIGVVVDIVGNVCYEYFFLSFVSSWEWVCEFDCR